MQTNSVCTEILNIIKQHFETFVFSEEIQEIQRKESQSLSVTPNLFVYGNDVDSVDIAVRVAMVRYD